jgi:AcrR family transcriptional regulator
MSVISQPANARSRRTRGRLLAAARDILEGEGFERLTMTAVAERAGVTRRSVYLHFPSRADLVNGLFAYLAEQEGLDGSLAPVWDAPDSVAALDQWARHLARYHPKLLAVSQAVERVRSSDADAAGHHQRVVDAQLTNCRRLAEWLQREERLASPWSVATATDMLFALISTDMIGRLVVDRHWSTKRLGDRLSLLLRSTFT